MVDGASILQLWLQPVAASHCRITSNVNLRLNYITGGLKLNDATIYTMPYGIHGESLHNIYDIL